MKNLRAAFATVWVAILYCATIGGHATEELFTNLRYQVPGEGVKEAKVPTPDHRSRWR